MMYDRLVSLLMEIDTNRRTLQGITTAGGFYLAKKQAYDKEDQAIAKMMTKSGNPTKPAKVKTLRSISAAYGNAQSQQDIQNRRSATIGLNRAHQDYKRYRANYMRNTGQAGDPSNN